MSLRFGARHENNELASRLHLLAEVELGLDDSKSVELELLASSLESRSDTTWSEWFLRRFTWVFNRGGTHS